MLGTKYLYFVFLFSIYLGRYLILTWRPSFAL